MDKFHIYQDVRKFLNVPLAAHNFNEFINSSSMAPFAPAIKDNRIDWNLTSKVLHATQVSHHEGLSKMYSYHIKNLTHSLPHGDVKHRNFPQLFTNPHIRCPTCGIHEHM